MMLQAALGSVLLQQSRVQVDRGSFCMPSQNKSDLIGQKIEPANARVSRGEFESACCYSLNMNCSFVGLHVMLISAEKKSPLCFRAMAV